MVRLILVFVLCLIAGAAPGWAGKRVALVIGNAAYSNFSVLANPHNDAEAIAGALRKAAFDEVLLVNDLDRNGLNRALQKFSGLANGAEVALVYYAGHGVEVNGINYLVPTDAELQKSTDVAFEAIPLDLARNAVAPAAALRMVVLDACRNNPFKLADVGNTRAARRGLRAVEAEASEYIAYSAKEGTTAQDGPPDGNSPFAAALVKAILEPGLDVRLMFGKVRDDVVKATNREQEPFTYSSLGGDAVYLNPPKEKPVETPVAVAPPAPALLAINLAWPEVKASRSEAVIKSFMAQYKDDPNFGVYGALADERLKLLRDEASAVVIDTPVVTPPVKLVVPPPAEILAVEPVNVPPPAPAPKPLIIAAPEKPVEITIPAPEEPLDGPVVVPPVEPLLLTQPVEPTPVIPEPPVYEVAAAETTAARSTPDVPEAEQQITTGKAETKTDSPVNTQLASLEPKDGAIPTIAPAPVEDDASQTKDPATDEPSPVLLTSLQRELTRIGCYSGKVDGKWGNGSEAAIQEYNGLLETKLSDLTPSEELLANLKATDDGACKEEVPPKDVQVPKTKVPGNAKQPEKQDTRRKPIRIKRPIVKLQPAKVDRRNIDRRKPVVIVRQPKPVPLKKPVAVSKPKPKAVAKAGGKNCKWVFAVVAMVRKCS